MPSSTVEDYIKHIFLLSEELPSDEVPMGRVAEAAGVVPGTATTMVKALADARLVDYMPRIGVRLTRTGRKLALRMLRRHRLIEQFLVQVLDFDWSEVHEEAERLEHVVSDLLLERINNFLGHPTEDPHGDPIPTDKGELAEGSAHSLADCELHTVFEVERIHDQNAAFLNYIASAGLSPGAKLKVLTRNHGAESTQVEIDGNRGTHTLRPGSAAKVAVRWPEHLTALD